MSAILIVYGTVSGNAESCANDAADKLRAQGFEVDVEDIDDVTVEALAKRDVMLLSIATYGDGEPPDSAWDMWNEIVEGEPEHDLSGLSYSVLALGDTDYEQFCEAGKAFDAAFEKHGARRLAPRVDCDLEYEEPAAAWIESVQTALRDRQVTDESA